MHPIKSKKHIFAKKVNVINVTTEIGQLRRVLIHSPDAGIGKIVPRIKDKLLYDDIAGRIQPVSLRAAMVS